MNWRYHHYADCGCRWLSGGFLCLTLPWLAAQGTARSADTDLFLDGSIPSLRIELAAAAVGQLQEDPREFVPATVTEGRAVYRHVAVHLKGSTGSFRAFADKPGLTLDFGRFENGRKFHGLRRIHLNNSVEDPSYVNEKIGSELFLAAGLPAPRVTRAWVTLNEHPPRLYVLKEGFTEDFLRRHFQKISGELYEPGEGHDVNEPLARISVAALFDRKRSALKQLAAAAAESDPSRRWPGLQEALETKQFLSFMAAEVILGHRDGYCINRNNFRVYHDLDSGKMVFLPHGMDQLFGAPDFPWQPQWAGVVAQAVMSTPEGQQGYASAFGALLTNQFNVEKLMRRVDELVGELRDVLPQDEYAGVQAAAAVVKQRIAQRKASLMEQFSRPALKPLEFTAGCASPQGWEVGERPAQGEMNRVAFAGHPTLHISAGGETQASWRSMVLLPSGHYHFTDRVRVAGVQSLSRGGRAGARLRISHQRSESVSLSGDTGWQELAADFVVGPTPGTVELICELRARAGEVWYDLPAMRLLKLDQNYEN